MAMIDDQETLQIFLEDAREHLRGIERTSWLSRRLVAPWMWPWSTKRFAPYSIKGGAGFLGLDAIKDLAHAMESLST
jgi:two-component system chemotaxis sensor kinase CheA